VQNFVVLLAKNKQKKILNVLPKFAIKNDFAIFGMCVIITTNAYIACFFAEKIFVINFKVMAKNIC